MAEGNTGELLREVARLHGQLQRRETACCGGTTPTQCQVLTELGRGGPITLGELAGRLDLDKSWVSRTVESLARAQLLEKHPSELDRRTVLVSLTPAGEARCRELNATLDALARRVLERIPAPERPGVVAALRLLEQALQAEAAGR